MAINFKSITLEVIDINTNPKPDIYINQNCITFSRRVLEDLGFPQNVQYCVDANQKVFAIRPCKANEAKAVAFSKPKAEQSATLTCGNRNLRDVLVTMIPGYAEKQRYKLTGEFDSESRVMYFDMATAEKCTYRSGAGKEE